MKLFFRLISWLVVIGVTAYFFWFAFNTLDGQDFSGLSSLPVVLSIVMAAFLYSSIIPVSAWAWTLLLKSHGEAWSFRFLAAVMGVTQAAKYIPGNFAQHVGRAALAIRHGMKLQAFTVSVVQESILAVGASVLVGVGLLQVSPGGFNRLPDTYQNMLFLACMLLAAALIVLSMGLFKLPDALRRYEKVMRLFEFWGGPLGPRTTMLVFSAYCINYLVIGLGMWCVAYCLGVRFEGGYALLTASFSLAWLLGFLAPGAPAGLGVREGVFVLLLAGIVEDERVLSLILAMRIVTVLGDGLCWAAGFVGLHVTNRRIDAN